MEERHYYVVPPEVHHHHHEPAPRPPLHDELPPVTVEERRYGPFPMGAPFTPERHAFVRSHEYDEPPLTWSGHKPLAVPHYSGPPVMPEPPELRVIELEPPAPLLASPTFIEPARYTSSRYVPAPVEEPVQYVVPAVPPPERVLEYHHEYHPQEVQVVESAHYHQPAALEAQTYYIDHETGERLTEAEYQVRRELRLSHQEVVVAQSPQEVVTSYVTSHAAAPPQPRNLGTQTFYRDPETGEEIAEAEFAMRYPSIFGQLHGQGEGLHVETYEPVQAATTWVSHAEPASGSGLQNFYVDPETREEISEAEFARRYAGTYLGALVGHGESEVEYLQPTTTYVISQEVEAEAAEPPQPQRPPVPTPSTVSSYTQPEELFTSPARSLDRLPLFTRDESETPKPEARPAPKRVGAYDNVRSRVFEQPKRKPSPSRTKPAKPAPKRGRTPSTRKGDLETPQPNSTTPQPHPANFVMESEQF